MGTIPTPPTIATGADATSTVMNQYRDAINFWAKTPRCMAYGSTATTMGTSGTAVVIALQSEIYDIVQSGDTPSHDNTTNNSRIFFRTTGIYEIEGQIHFVSNATGNRFAQIRLNAAGNPASGTLLVTSQQAALAGGFGTSVPLPVIEGSFTAGDYIEMFGTQTSGGSLDTVSGSATTFMRIKLTGSP